ncbi:helix-loop-helix protein delilah-like [Chrysoperla carnea]|uniref:helix-loop-helix protein delilah-like n=1 Tax=Chrysoperla carnea TaxID=189513 RepID=UPI001D074A97|nr:helix-loop-helix protein delilah-like [Chrysoperla carnea]
MLTPQYCDMNTQSDKYSLRPRSLIRKGRKQLSANIDLINNNYEIKLKNCDLQTQQQQQSNIPTQQQSKTNKKAPPLSKYRRKTANARERSRMREINYAFEALRRAVPHIFVLQCPSLNNSSCSNQQSSPSEKLTKITTLRLAMRYINALSSVLNNNNNNMLNNHNELSQDQDTRQLTEDQDLEQTSHSFMELTSDESTSSLSLCNDNLYDDQHACSSLMSMSMSIDSRQSLVSNIYDDQLSLLEQNNLTYLSSDVGTCLDFTDQSLSPSDFTEQHSLSPFDELFEPTF